MADRFLKEDGESAKVVIRTRISHSYLKISYQNSTHNLRLRFHTLIPR